MTKKTKIILIFTTLLITIMCIIWVTKPSNDTITKNNKKTITNVTKKEINEEPLEKKVDATSYEMDLSLDTNKKTLTETVSINIENNTDKTVNKLCIRDMTPEILTYCEKNYKENNKNLNSEILSITLKDNNKSLDYSFGKNKSIIYITLDTNDEIKIGEKKSISIQMKTDIPNRGDRFGYLKTKKGTLFALSFCFPYLADNDNGKWILDPFFDDGESRSYDLADYSVQFKAPKSFTVATTGYDTTTDNITKSEIKNVRDFAIVACDFMEKETFNIDDIKINNYYLNGTFTNEYRKVSKAVTKDSINIYTDQIGKYPYKELDIVPTLFGFSYGGMEFPCLVMINSSLFFDSSFYDALTLEDKICHEIAHQWFYATVGNREYTESWIDEGFATLLEKDIYGLAKCDAHNIVDKLEEDYISIKDKEEYRNDMIQAARKDYKDIYINIPPNEYTPEQSYGDAEYSGSYLFLQEVRLLIGDKSFSEFLKNYYKTFYMKTVKTDDVLDFIKQYNNSEEMNEIINFYFKFK